MDPTPQTHVGMMMIYEHILTSGTELMMIHVLQS
jgi:hypothetical protein